jgi:hypothetical protein
MQERIKKEIQTNRLHSGNAGNKKKSKVTAADAQRQAKNAGAASFPYPAEYLTLSEGGSSRQIKLRNRQQARFLLHYCQE